MRSALARDEDKPPAPTILTDADFERIDRRRLIDPSNLQLFVLWHSLGGPLRPPSPLELREWPAAMVQDFKTLTIRMGELRRQMERRNSDRS